MAGNPIERGGNFDPSLLNDYIKNLRPSVNFQDEYTQLQRLWQVYTYACQTNDPDVVSKEMLQRLHASDVWAARFKTHRSDYFVMPSGSMMRFKGRMQRLLYPTLLVGFWTPEEQRIILRTEDLFSAMQQTLPFGKRITNKTITIHKDPGSIEVILQRGELTPRLGLGPVDLVYGKPPIRQVSATEDQIKLVLATQGEKIDWTLLHVGKEISQIDILQEERLATGLFTFTKPGQYEGR